MGCNTPSLAGSSSAPLGLQPGGRRTLRRKCDWKHMHASIFFRVRNRMVDSLSNAFRVCTQFWVNCKRRMHTPKEKKKGGTPLPAVCAWNRRPVGTQH
jgi:hypothetical protein